MLKVSSFIRRKLFKLINFIRSFSKYEDRLTDWFYRFPPAFWKSTIDTGMRQSAYFSQNYHLQILISSIFPRVFKIHQFVIEFINMKGLINSLIFCIFLKIFQILEYNKLKILARKIVYICLISLILIIQTFLSLLRTKTHMF